MGDPSDPLRYQLRGDRCEGTFVHTIANSFDLFALTQESLAFEPDRQESLIVTWPLLAQSIHLQARSTSWPTDDRSHRLYYQMDSIRPSTDTRYVWTLDVVRRLRLRGDSVGLVGFVELPLEGRKRLVYVPLGRPDAGAGAGSRYRATFIPSRQMVAVKITVSKNGARKSYSVPLKQKAFFPSQPFDVSLSFAKPGLYQVRVDEDLGASPQNDRQPDGGVPTSELLTFLLLHGQAP